MVTIQDPLLKPIFISIQPKDIVFLKNIIESYEGLGIVRTLDQKKAVIVLLALVDTYADAQNLLASLKEEGDLNFEIIKEGYPLDNDWLLSE
jgi:hypothetical protein